MSWGLDNVTVRFGSLVALDRVSLPAVPGSVTVLVGGDGAGKTTCLRALVGLVEPEEGAVSRPVKDRIGYVPATAGIYLDLTVRENLAFCGRAFGLAGPDLWGRVAAVVDRVGLSGAEDRLGGHLSGGMRRKLAVGTALLHAPDLLVLDEPTTGVDPVSRADLWRLIAGSAARGATVVVATTYVLEAARAGFAVLVESGRTLASGPPEELVARVGGAIGRVDRRPPGGECWRRGDGWRVWAPTGFLPRDAVAVHPDLVDAVVVASLQAEALGGVSG
jgi:ABC-2 type transport system ATP-binding protein